MSYEGLEKTGGGDFAKWPVVGTQMSGVVKAKYVATPSFDDAVPCPHLDVETADGSVTISATQTALRNLLIDRDAEFAIGDTVTITHSGMSGNAKLFSLTVHPAVAAAATAGATAPVEAAGATAAAGQAPPLT